MGVETMNHQMQMQMQMQMQIHGARPPFTPSQWQELEHQALIFKYMVAGIPVPPDLLVPIRKSLEAISAGLFHPHHHPPDMPWSSTFQLGYGKNCDPEPGRCRRTDGKKWRCSKDAFPDSKYCERHMHRGRNRSRKPVETPHASSHSSSLTLSTTARPTNNNNSSSSITSNNSHTFSSPSPYSSSSRLSGGGIVVQPNNANVNHFHLDSPSFARDYRYMKGDMDEHIFFSSEVSGTASRGLGIESQSLLSSTSSMDAGWRSNPPPKVNALFNSFPKQQQQHSFLNSSFGGTVKMEAQDHDEDNNTQEQDHEHEQPLRHFFDDWPATRSRDSSSGLSWCDLEERCNTSSAHHGNHRASATSSSTTQLSISIPINSSDFSASKSK